MTKRRKTRGAFPLFKSSDIYGRENGRFSMCVACMAVGAVANAVEFCALTGRVAAASSAVAGGAAVADG